MVAGSGANSAFDINHQTSDTSSGPEHSRTCRGSPEEGALPFANEIARVLAAGQETGPNGELALRVLPIVGRGGLHDIRDVLSLPGADLAITQEHMLARLQETKELGDLKTKLVYITKLFSEELHVVARQDIRQLSDLAGKPVNVGDTR